MTMKRRTHALLGVLLAIGLGASARQAAAITDIDACRIITHSGSFKLTKNLAANGDCLIVAAEFVTIDLNGHTITGNGTGVGVTDRLGFQGIVVRNGTLTNFGEGVNLIASPFCVIERLRVINNSRVGILVGRGSIVSGNIAVGNASSGIIASAGSTVMGNIARENGGNGIQVTCPSTVTGNAATGNSSNVRTFGSGCNTQDHLGP